MKKCVNWYKLSKDGLNQLNKNVKFIFLYGFLGSLSFSIWMETTLSAYIFLLTGGSNQMVGYTAGGQK